MKQRLMSGTFATFVFFLITIAIPWAVISQPSASDAVACGRRLFNQSCAPCHDTLGTVAKSGPELKNLYRHQLRPADAAVGAIIKHGKGRMPGFSTFDQTQLADLLAYLKTL